MHTVDGVVNRVGSLLLKPAHITTDEEWDATIATNLRSVFGAVRAGAKAMRSAGGSVVLVSSAAAQIGLANHEAIAAAKGGVIGLTLPAAASYASSGIRVNALAPRLVRTALTERLTANDKAEEASLAMHALGRLGGAGGRGIGNRLPSRSRQQLDQRPNHRNRRRAGVGSPPRLSGHGPAHPHRRDLGDDGSHLVRAARSYPLFAGAGSDHFTAYEGRHTRRTTRVVGVFMPIEAVTAAWPAFDTPAGVSDSLVAGGAVLVAALWV